jgi:Zn finger protein HypA/HybF involved in hydrogenase expression
MALNTWLLTMVCEKCKQSSTVQVEYERGVSQTMVCESEKAEGCPKCDSWAVTIVVADRIRP